MSKNQVSEKETVPGADDDEVIETTVETVDEAPKAEAKPERPKPQPYVDERREAIAKRFRELRSGAKQDDEADDDSASHDGDDPPADVEKAEKAASEPARADAEDPEIVMIVDGREVKKPLSEVKRIAQMNLAADNRLEAAKRMADEAARKLKELEHQPVQQATQHPDRSRDEGAPEHQPGARDPEKLKTIVERIQVGDIDDGVAALGELIELTGAKAQVDATAIGPMVRDHIVQERLNNELTTSLARFADQYPELAKDELLQDAGKTVLRREIIQDLKSIGVTDELLAPVINSTEVLVAAYKQARVKGHNLRSYDEILNSVGKAISPYIAKPNPQPPQPSSQRDPASDRQSRKASLQSQPRASGSRGVVTTPAKKTSRDIVAEFRRQRGFTI